MTDSFIKQMQKEMKQLGIDLTDLQMDQFYRYFELLVETNKFMNLTAITEEKDVVSKHFSDSLSLVKAFSNFKNIQNNFKAIIDVGTGAGFPGIPLKIAFPDLQLTLLDSLNKRVKFLQNVCDELNLLNVICVHGRAEDFGRNSDYREKYDLCVSRAVANLASLSEYCMPFVKVGGYFVPYKSGEIREELKAGERAVEILGGEIEDICEFFLPGTDVGRSLVKIKKIKNTGKRFPRKAGMPTKEPLG